eukprot:CAMPEP_0197075854 /NCGR_PEP_ID=MMETSP1384-20130603/211818_1 /TAXON_ID=29189 /ORGANISM="Ammonia sp." /LENGTH=560 /DNA_ID=CAMNT_0042514703 /DNA_START=180 /DNA_END=1862 /DNA_ORIENTATION=+
MSTANESTSNNNTLTDRQSSCFSPSSSSSSSSSTSSTSAPPPSTLPTPACSTAANSKPGAAVNRDDRHALTQDPIDNHTLTSIINSILTTTPHGHGEPHSTPSGSTNDDGTPSQHATDGNNDDVVQQYLLPVDLLVSIDKSNKPTVKAALPSSFAFQQPMPISFLSAYAPPMASLSSLTPQMNPLSMSSIPQMAQYPQLASMPMALPTPSIPLSVLMSQPQQMPTTLPMAGNSLLNPSAASFTPSVGFTPFATPMMSTPIAPISEGRAVEKEQHNSNNQDAEAANPWVLMDENQGQSEYYRAPKLSSKASNDAATETMDSFVYPRQDTRAFHKNWRSFNSKPHELDMNPIPPRWRVHQHQKEKPAAKHLHISYRVNQTMTDAVKPKPKLMAEFVEHVTLPNRENYPPNTVFTKTWAMKNSGELEWGFRVELVYVKGDENLSLYKRVPVRNAQPGETVEISATIKTPSIPGRYCTYFRLQKNNRFFGPRVWCDIIVGGVNPNSNPLETKLNGQACANEVVGKPDMVNHDKILTQRAALRWKKKYAAKNSQVPSYYKFVSCK